MKKLILIASIFFAFTAQAQDSAYIRSKVDTLTSAAFWGRGYTNNGMQKAASFLQQQFASIGLLSFDKNNYQQPFDFPVNTFPGEMQVSINDKLLQPGKDYIVAPDAKGVKASGDLVQKDSVTFIDAKNRIIVVLENKLTWSVAQEVVDYTLIKVDKKALATIPTTVAANIENKFVKRFYTGNVCGYVKGTQYPDSVIFITAHYDHLGGMGKSTYFPGANDNASGTSFLLSLATYYAQHPQPYTIGFICFASEEAGLVGSKYFTEHPLIPLPRIKFLLNFDLVGTGDDGVTVVNATEYPQAFSILKSINDNNHYLAAVKVRGKAANSDHYWFTEKGVPAFFIYTMGGIAAYHDVFDKGATLPLNEVNDLGALVKEFVGKLQ